ncbi:hypothetical protein K505DRAFT_31453 [Melanomma pulvis-pyrius CBS 109.77]|uniref:Uncharacterized protein n=1 Tax=Melanomma pulvis-pyrius CBS 109.77 TaxID=1314802 RepID=A0A6A6XDP9_9PLEO|nr:hypothetical protein K505DRAFT_31453 [Melanomma pulvis-pyrius CBS 109.77]
MCELSGVVAAGQNQAFNSAAGKPAVRRARDLTTTVRSPGSPSSTMACHRPLRRHPSGRVVGGSRVRRPDFPVRRPGWRGEGGQRQRLTRYKMQVAAVARNVTASVVGGSERRAGGHEDGHEGGRWWARAVGTRRRRRRRKTRCCGGAGGSCGARAKKLMLVGWIGACRDDAPRQCPLAIDLRRCNKLSRPFTG